MREAFICDYVRTPIGRYGGALSGIRTDDLAAQPLKSLMARHAASTGSGSTTSSTAAPTRRARTTATWRAWPA
jgi:acetyl-CoA acetyltransferase